MWEEEIMKLEDLLNTIKNENFELYEENMKKIGTFNNNDMGLKHYRNRNIFLIQALDVHFMSILLDEE